MKWLLLHVLFSHFLCVIFIFPLSSIILLSQFHFVARKIAVTLNFIFRLSTNCLV